MKKIVYVIVCLFAAFTTKGQAPFWAWGHTFNGNISAIEYDNDYIYTAICFSNAAFSLGNVNIPNNGAQDVVVAKWDTLGNLIWAKSIWGSAKDTVIKIRILNNVVEVYGSSVSPLLHVDGITISLNGNVSNFVAKYDLNGNAFSAFKYFDDLAYIFPHSICFDHLDNIYLSNIQAGFSHIYKFTSSGVLVWHYTGPPNSSLKLSYSAYDSTIVVAGSFKGTYTRGNSTITTGNINNLTDVFVEKATLSGGPVWLINVDYNPADPDAFMDAFVDDNNGKIFLTYYRYGNSVERVISPAGAVASFNFPPINGALDSDHLGHLMTGRDSILILSRNNMYVNYDPVKSSIHVYNMHTQNQFLSYTGIDANDYIRFLAFKSPNSIFTHGFDSVNNTSYKLGKIGDGSLIGIPSMQTQEHCYGNVVTLSGNITGGTGPLSYSWLPVIGLNNTNTNTVSFTATANISYTLTVTDGVHTARDTFNIIVQNPIPAPNLTSQYPSVCDSMKLYANNGIAGNWHRFVPANPPNMLWQMLGTDTTITVYAAGTYKYAQSNACNSVADTIVVAGTVIVNANASSDSICAGQSVTLNGTGAVSYVWTGGVFNNIAFIPAATETFIVTGSDANGCTNTSFVTITISNSTDTSNLSICAAQTPYSWNGQNLASSGTYTATYTNAYGCDSVLVLNLTVSPCIVCVQDYVISYSPFYNALTESQSWIITSGTVLIPAGVKVKLDAHQSSFVKLNPGFKAEYGSVFVAQAYNGCTAGAPQLPQSGKMLNEKLSASNEIVLYPNPTTGMIHIQHDENVSDIQVIDMVGRRVMMQKCKGETETNIDLSNLPDGVYHVKAAGYQAIKVVKNE